MDREITKLQYLYTLKKLKFKKIKKVFKKILFRLEK